VGGSYTLEENINLGDLLVPLRCSAATPSYPAVFCSSDQAILDDSEEGYMTVIDWNVRQLEWWNKKLDISDYGVAWIAFAKGLVLGYALCFFI
jgi:hypothetical protein